MQKLCKVCGDNLPAQGVPWQAFCSRECQEIWHRVKGRVIYRVGKEAVTDEMIRAELRKELEAKGGTDE